MSVMANLTSIDEKNTMSYAKKKERKKEMRAKMLI